MLTLTKATANIVLVAALIATVICALSVFFEGLPALAIAGGSALLALVAGVAYATADIAETLRRTSGSPD